MHEYRVGSPYSPTRTHWPEAVEYNYRSGGHELRMFLPSPGDGEVEAVRHGAASFALYIEHPVLLLLYRFADTIEWSDAPYSWWMVAAEMRGTPPVLAKTERVVLSITLVDADTGIIRALRALSWSAGFSAQMHRAIRQQAEGSFDQGRFDQTLERIYQRYPKTISILPHAIRDQEEPA